MTNLVDLEGKRILLIGASGDIGKNIAAVLSNLGASIVICGRNRGELEQIRLNLETKPCSVEYLDLHNVDGLSDWIKSLAKVGGSFFGLVHCAGVSARTPIRTMKWPEAEEMMRINWGSAWALSKAFRQHGVHDANDSRIVMISSTAGLVGESAMTAYSSSKGAMISLARSLAVELAGEGIRVNTVAPGFIKTKMNEEYLASISPDQLQALESRYPLGFGTVADVSGTVAFLLSEMGRWISGVTIPVDGGMTAI